MNRITKIALCTIWVLPAAMRAEDPVDKEAQTDVLLKAMLDELARNRDGLALEGLERPYFLEYGMQDAAGASVTARLGAVTDRGDSRSRQLRADVRVGSYKLDNTNFAGDFGGFGFFGGGAPIPLEDDYNAIRQAIWWSTDRTYKQVSESLERKKAFMAQKVIEDKPDDFSKESPAVHFEPRIAPQVDAGKLESLAVELSKLFLSQPGVQSSSVSVTGGGGNKYLVNSEGTRIRVSSMRYTVSVSATVQADDGMELSDAINITVRRFEDLPGLDELKTKTGEMVALLLKLKDAPKLESYSGPVLFDAPAATRLFSVQFGRRLLGGQRPVGGQNPPDDFEKRIGERVLPKGFDVVDDPTLKTLGDQTVMGHYAFDDQGVPAQKVDLIEAGKLKNLLMSRNPSKKFKQSNGHGRGPWRPMAFMGCMIVSAKEGQDDAELKKTLVGKAEDADREFGIRIASLGGGGTSQFGRFGRFGEFDGGGMTPLAVYKVFPDGKEELVRGVQLGMVDLKAFKRIVAAGKTPHVQNSGGAPATTTAVPALLFEELDLTKIERDFDKPPILPSPLARPAETPPPAAP